MRVKKIAIIGGGTAGWLAANHLAVELRAEHDISITVIESSEIGIIGVGEGTVPHIRKSLQKFGISEAELLAECDATFKVGIKFIDWLAPGQNQAANSYYHPFSSPYPGGLDVTAMYLQNAADMEFSSLTEVAAMADAMKAPKKVSSGPFEAPINYAYHFNALKFGQLLARNATERLGVHRKQATVVDAVVSSSGDVDYLLTKEGEQLQFDFFVDCTGFNSLLLGGLYKVPFVDKSSQILTDTALTVQIPTDSNGEIPPYTLAKAHAAGWLWDIPLTNRRGVGFVYASSLMPEERALEGLAAHLGQRPDRLSPRKIGMRIGYREKFWHQNVVALGLAQGFVEPLEATSIFVTDLAAELFARNFSPERGTMAAAAAYCNQVVAYTWERVMDFVQLHYCISDRRDSEFWRLNTEAAQISEVLAQRLAMWRVNPPKKSDFFSRFDLFDVENFLFVLYGMKYPTKARAMTSNEVQAYVRELNQVKGLEKALAGELIGHREWLSGFLAAYREMQRK